MKKVFLIILLVIAIGTFVVHQVSIAKSKPKGDLVLTSKKVRSAPSDTGSSQWNKAQEAKMVITGAGKFEGKDIELKTKSVYTKDEIFFRFEWPDPDKSMPISLPPRGVRFFATTNPRMKKSGILRSARQKKKPICGTGKPCDPTPWAIRKTAM